MSHKRRPLTSEEQAKLTALREEINRAYEQGGSYTDEEVGASIEAALDAWERKSPKA
jgi:DNA-binding IclR family transcriptional regulator